MPGPSVAINHHRFPRSVTRSGETLVHPDQIGRRAECRLAESIGYKITSIRIARGWTQRQLGDACGLSLNFIGRIERGLSVASITSVIRIAHALGTDPNDLIGWPECLTYTEKST